MIAKCVSGNSFATFATAGGLVEPDRDDEVGVLAGGGREVRHVVLGRRGLIDVAADAELLLRPLEPLVGELVEAVVVQLVDVGDEDDERGRARRARAAARRRRRSRPGRRVPATRSTARAILMALKSTDPAVTCERTACRCDSLPFSWPRFRSGTASTDARSGPSSSATRPRRTASSSSAASTGPRPPGIAITRRLIAAGAPSGTEIVVVPAVNPDGCARGTRGNAHGVDLNRNFPSNWAAIGRPGDLQYSGPHAVVGAGVALRGRR